MVQKYVVQTLEGEQMAYRYVPDADDGERGTIGVGGYLRDLHVKRRILQDVFGRQRVGSPRLTQANKGWLNIRGRRSDFERGVKMMEDAHMVLTPVTRFGRLVR